MSAILKLRGSVKTYQWGKLGTESCVAQLCKSAFADFEVEESTPYSELWMGTHPSGMSTVPSLNDLPLSEWIVQNPDSLGPNIRHNFGDTGLPFLFKILSVRTALSIQVHPDKKTAVKLHEKYADRYPDDNHKPEIAIALTPFHALCGFRPTSEIKSFIMELPDLRAVVGCETAEQFLNSPNGDTGLLKTAFTAMITREKSEFDNHLNNILHYFEDCPSLSDLCKSVKHILLKVCNEFPGDIGCFCVFFLNYVVLKPGQSIFLAANEPHAYLEGDCVECMACSDNVVRAGLTPKFKDVHTLCNMLTYSSKPASENLFQPIKSVTDQYLQIYDPPVPEFTVAQIEVPCSGNLYTLETLNSASVLIVIEGDGEVVDSKLEDSEKSTVSRGTILFISSQSQVKILVVSPKILMYRAYCNEMFSG